MSKSTSSKPCPSCGEIHGIKVSRHQKVSKHQKAEVTLTKRARSTISPTSEYIQFEELGAWTASDYGQKKGFYKKENLDFTVKGVFGGSELATDGFLFKNYSQLASKNPKLLQNSDYPFLPYYQRNSYSNYDDVGTGVPGPFEYVLDIDKWDGDETFGLGPAFYSIILAHFGHAHIGTVHTKEEIKNLSFEQPTHAQDLMLEHLAEGSIKIFGFFANVFDADGRPVEDLDNRTMFNTLKKTMKMLVTGDGISKDGENQDPFVPGYIRGKFDFREIVAALNGFTSQLNTRMKGDALPKPGATDGHPLQGLVDTVDEMDKFLRVVLRVDVDGAPEIPAIAWGPLMRMHQDGEYISFVKFREVFINKKGTQEFEDAVRASNKHSLMMLDGARQMAAFFGMFYSATSYLDQFLNFILMSMGQKGPFEMAIPDNVRTERVRVIHDVMTRNWSEHMALFEDWNKCCAYPNRTPKIAAEMYKAQHGLYESCGLMAAGLGRIFQDFDRLIRGRGLFKIFAQIPDSQ